MHEDAELLRLYANEQSQAAFAELVGRHVDLVFSVALPKVGCDAHAAQDVTQTVFLALARQASKLTGRRSVAGWLYLTTQHHAAQHVRAERRRQNREIRAHTMNEILNTPDVDWPQLRPVLDDTLRELNDAEREVILLRYFEGQSFAMIGRTFQVSEDAARMRADRALEKLRTFLARRGLSSTAATLAGVLGQQLVAAPKSLASNISSAVATLSAPSVIAKPFMSFPHLLAGGALVAIIVFTVTRFSDRASSSRMPMQPSSANSIPNHLPASLAQSTDSVAAAQPQSPQSTTTVSRRDLPAAEIAEPRESTAAQQASLLRQLAGYQPFFEKLHLTADQRDVFKELLAAHLQRQADIDEIGRTQGARPVDADLEAMRAESDAQLSARVQAAFGPAVADRFKHFNETAPVREFVYHLTEALANTATPLSDEQREQLIEHIANHSRNAEGQITRDPHALEIETTIRDGQNPLSPPQIAALRRLHLQPR